MHDIILGVCNWLLVAALLFSLARPRLHVTAPLTSASLGAIAVTFASMAYWQAFAPVACASLCWLVISTRAIIQFSRRATWESSEK